MPKQDHPRHPTTKNGDEANIYAQLNADEFGDVEYHLDFDPIAAAQGESRRLHPRSASRSEQQARKDQLAAAEEDGVEPITIDLEPVPRWV
ncbi:hypothetical protein ANCDUO_14922 [Ancylostoma duodenale]|uniref:Uncharacterized protein n=1 Tax=Ancylostoma duodenale TaxID=51022 RepID=A0A0C2G1W1_9BILA|nr:hypothetical protein ANCDUO_14922 [Ancylostoma duodenale]